MSAEDIYRALIMQNEEVGVATIYRVKLFAIA
jgi:Fe2+ or Zn2+ uptake regulation protein